MNSPTATLGRTALRVRGLVQGVGFRPFVYRLAREMDLAGFVRNDSHGVWIEIEGELTGIGRFRELLELRAPSHARIESIETLDVAILHETAFEVRDSVEKGGADARIPADLATCDECLRELFDPSNRRWRYPFINCTACGPRFTIVKSVPYDRRQTTMQPFELCAFCRSEYENPLDRRFHAEPNACGNCGPRLELSRDGRTEAFGEKALEIAVSLLAAGGIVALKGLGGFHLAVDATNQEAVLRLRQRKHRPHKPFAVMARDLAAAESIARIDSAARELLVSPQRPVVLLPRRDSAIAPSVAPHLDEVGVMLPYTPLHHLLLAETPLLVMTSGNRADEPIAIDNGDAMDRLGSIADAFLLHDRAIHSRADDSVIRICDGESQPVRRSRGYVPEPIDLGITGPSILAVGAELKSTVCLTRGSEAFVSQHIGDLGSTESLTFFEEVIERFSRLLSVTPAVVAHDLHPDYASTRWALGSGLRRIGVQHHHAHIASCLAEHRRTDTVIGIAFDGTGCGPAGELWGGEILVADPRASRRAGHLRPLELIGGQAAIREPWRLALAALGNAGENFDLLHDLSFDRLNPVATMARKGIRTARSTSAGRWFDAVAALCGVRREISYEAQAAIELEALADPSDVEPYSFALADSASMFEVDLRPTIREIAADLRVGTSTSVISARFHETLSSTIAASAVRVRLGTGLNVVALSGGCFQNRRLSRRSRVLLEADGFEVLEHRLVPPNDGGIALGQALVAAHRLSEE